MYYNENDPNNEYDEYNSACEFDDDRTCSTCSYSSSNTTSSTDSDCSDLDDGFGCDPLMENYGARANYPRNNSNSSQMKNYGGVRQDTFQRKFNSGVKISYVDSLPLARTNPAPPPQEIKKKKKSSGDKQKKKSISKFKKDNCTVS